VAVAYQGFAAVYIGWWKQQGVVVHPLWAVGFGAALVYATVYNLWLKQRLKRSKWETEERRRARSLSVSISRVAACARAGKFTPVDLDQVEHGLLAAIKSEVEAVVVDTEGIYLNVTLLIEDPTDATRLYGLNRAELDRDLHKSYPKDVMIAWRAMETGTFAYEPRFETREPYRSILAIPIVLSDAGSTATSLGALSIDSEREHHFDDREQRIERKLLPYVTLLKLVLVYRQLVMRGHGGGHIVISARPARRRSERHFPCSELRPGRT
jgi:hypothetical protein